jgi:hypothetical protein
MANEIEESDKMKTQENTAPPMVSKSPLLDALNTVRARREARRQRSTTAAAKAAAKAPEWAQSIWELQQAHDTFSRLFLETTKFAETKGYELDWATGGTGYDLRRDRKLVLGSRPMFVIVEHLGAQHIWKDV